MCPYGQLWSDARGDTQSAPHLTPIRRERQLVAAPSVGDVDGSGKLDVVAVTRDGWLWVCRIPGAGQHEHVRMALGPPRNRQHRPLRAAPQRTGRISWASLIVVADGKLSARR